MCKGRKKALNKIRPLKSLIGSKLGWIRFFLLQIWQKAIPETEMDSLFPQRQKNKQKEGREDTKIAENSSRESFSAALCSKQIIIHFAKKCFFYTD